MNTNANDTNYPAQARRRPPEMADTATHLELAGQVNQDGPIATIGAINAGLAKITHHWPTLAPEDRDAVVRIVCTMAGKSPAPNDADLPALNRPASIIYDALLKRPPHQAMTRAEMLDLLAADFGITMSSSTLAARVIPQLRRRGVAHTHRVGYSIPARLRLCA